MLKHLIHRLTKTKRDAMCVSFLSSARPFRIVLFSHPFYPQTIASMSVTCYTENNRPGFAGLNGTFGPFSRLMKQEGS